MKTKYEYVFPAIRGFRRITMQEQMAKINEEAYELQMEILSEKKSRRWILLEAMNVIHAVETLFRIMEAKDDELEAAVCETMYDNEKRGYYKNPLDEQELPEWLGDDD